MKIPKLLSISVVCLVFVVCVVAQAVLGLYIFFSNVFTNDIRFLLVGCIGALIIFTVYLFVLKITSYSKTHDEQKPKKHRSSKRKKTIKINNNFSAKNNYRELNPPPTPTPQEPVENPPITPEIQLPPPTTSSQPVFQKLQEEPTEKKKYNPVFGNTDSNQGS